MWPYLGPHEPIPTKFGLWVFFIILHQYMVSKMKKKKKNCDIITSVLYTFPESVLLISANINRGGLPTVRLWRCGALHMGSLVLGHSGPVAQKKEKRKWREKERKKKERKEKEKEEKEEREREREREQRKDLENNCVLRY